MKSLLLIICFNKSDLTYIVVVVCSGVGTDTEPASDNRVECDDERVVRRDVAPASRVLHVRHARRHRHGVAVPRAAPLLAGITSYTV